MSKNTYRTPQGFKEIPCSNCKSHKIRVDAESKGATCFRCVSKSMNPESIIVSDLSQEDYREFVRKMYKYGRPENNPAESAV